PPHPRGLRTAGGTPAPPERPKDGGDGPPTWRDRSLRSRLIGAPALCQEQPAAKCCWKQTKSAMLRVGSVVEPSQLARESPAAKRCWKQTKSAMLRMGGVEELSQLAKQSLTP